MKQVSCAEVGYFPDCDHVLRGADEDEVMRSAGEHAGTVHGLTEGDFTEERIAAIRGHIHDA